MKTSTRITVYDSASVPETETPQHWLGLIRGTPEPLLLSRLLQKLICQQALLEAVRYDLAIDGDAAIEFLFECVPSRAELLAKQWQTLVSVREVTLRPLSAHPAQRHPAAEPSVQPPQGEA